MNVIDAIRARSSTRAFVSKEVPQELISEVLSVARWAPSSKNTQPWHVVVATGATKQKITELLLQQNHLTEEPHPDLNSAKELPELYHQRAINAGMALYSALNIARDDKVKRLQQHEKNYSFFDAPVAMFFFAEQSLGEYTILDCGMFIENVVLAAAEFGLATCLQRSVVYYPEQLKTFFGKDYQDRILLTGMALGYPDSTAPENNYRTERAAVNEFTVFLD